MNEEANSNVTPCRCCGNFSFVEIKGFGSYPLCFDFPTNQLEIDQCQKHFLGLGQCRSCGVIQLSRPVPCRDLVSRWDWIKNKEPEKHLGVLARDISKACGPIFRKVLLVSEFDEVLGTALESEIPLTLFRLELTSRPGKPKPNSGQATVQQLVTSYNHHETPDLIGKFDLIICCRLLEHAHDTRKFVASLKRFLSPSGRILFEVPESTKSLAQGDVGMLWEEHTNYFTHRSLDRFIQLNGLKIDNKWTYGYPQEDAIAALVSAAPTAHDAEPQKTVSIDDSRRYVKSLGFANQAVRKFLKSCRLARGRIALFGAGHRAVMFLNLFGLQDLISVVIDDDPRKQGFFMPGTNIPIESSEYLASSPVGTCLFAIGIESEQKVLSALAEKIHPNVVFYSISPDSSLAIPVN